MPRIKPDIEIYAKIKVIGVGGSGGNTISRMAKSKIRGVDLAAANTDAQDLHYCLSPVKIQLGKNLTRGLGAGMNPALGEQAAEESKEEISEYLKGADMVFVTCGLGGGTGTGAVPVVAGIARELGALTIAVVTTPFSFEGAQRAKIAGSGLSRLKEKVDSLIVIQNDRVLNIVDKKATLLKSFSIIDDILKQGVQGISDLITSPGLVNVDFADIKTIMENSGQALMGVGRSSNSNRAEEAAREAISSPLLELSIDGARGLLFNIAGGEDLSMVEVNQAAKAITQSVDPEAKIIFGVTQDEKLRKGEIKITVIATGFNKEAQPTLFNNKKEENFNPAPFAEKNGRNKKNNSEEILEEGGEEWEVPAFLRRKK
ncbi:MAG: cell division protein FtsZ [Parcubacteria group bacterium CG11_big_fil_rev_8_21_14_0_20_39_14]|nr:MAG: cell division protein FtsZ [Parcubacteria group bacterium CG11_big_fil_rev_8_21_14_0_20_39_14]PIS35466.1 MAG: cell division protein FtsZ [Parcubacteria group bacterium CG08_land_8_20_14_0_20_38_56]